MWNTHNAHPYVSFSYRNKLNFVAETTVRVFVQLLASQNQKTVLQYKLVYLPISIFGLQSTIHKGKQIQQRFAHSQDTMKFQQQDFNAFTGHHRYQIVKQCMLKYQQKKILINIRLYQFKCLHLSPSLEKLPASFTSWKKSFWFLVAIFVLCTFFLIYLL